MKRLISLALVLAMAVTLLAGCSNKKNSHVTSEEVSLKMMETLASFMPEIAESAKYEFKELTATYFDVPIHLLFIVKERFNGINDGEIWMDPWNIFVMDLDSGNVYHVKNWNYRDVLAPETSKAASDANWNYEYYCTGQMDFLMDPSEVWTDIVTEEDFAALQQRSNAKLPEARNVLTVEKAEMVSSTNPHDGSEMNVMYVQVRNHAAPMEEYQQEWYAIDLDRGTLYDDYDIKNSHFDSLPEDAIIYLSSVRYKYSSRVYDGYILREETEIWDTMFEEHIEALNEQLLTGPVPQPMKPVPQNVTTYEIEGFSEHQNMLASLLNWFGMDGVSALSAMEYKGTIPEIDGGEYHLLFLSTDAPKGYHREDDMVIDLNTGYFYDSFRVDEGWPPLRYCEGIGMLLESYSLFRDGQQKYIWSKNEKRTELLTDKECAKLNEAVSFVELPEITEEEIIQEEMPMDENEEVIFEEESTEEFIPGETMEEVFEEAPQDVSSDLPWEPVANPSHTLQIQVSDSNTDTAIQAVKAFQGIWGHWSDTPVEQAMEYHCDYEDVNMMNLLLISTSHYYDFDGPWPGILLVDLDTGDVYCEAALVWPSTEMAVGKQEHIAMFFSGYDNYINGADIIWSDMEEILPLSQSEIDNINAKLQ